MMKDTYRPLPESVTIDRSQIEGLGLFATEDIKKDTALGVMHVYDTRFPDNYIRTPLAGFINHSEENNLNIMEFKDMRYAIVNRDVLKGEELTLRYTLYEL